MELSVKNVTHLVNKCGIYELIVNKKSYIGSSINLKNRLNEHLSDLNSENHSNKKLLRAYNKYKNIHFEIIEFCESDILIEREEYWYNIKGYYNLQNPKKTINKQCKKVYKFTLEGEFIEDYISAAEASRKNNIKSSAGISNACRNNTYFANEFLWSYVKEIPFRNNKAFIPVYMFKPSGEFVKKFSSSYEASRYLIQEFNLLTTTENVAGTIKQSIKKVLIKGKCAHTGLKNSKNNPIEVDHKNGRYNGVEVIDISNQKITDFQPLTRQSNLQKRSDCNECKSTSKRFDAKKLGYSVSFIEGGETYKSDIGCRGCYWFDCIFFKKSLYLKNEY
jgi:group I intron endonuclease